MEAWVLVLVLLQGGQPRVMQVVTGYNRETCDRAVYMLQSSPPPPQPQQKELLRPMAWCVLGPGRVQ